MTKEIRTMIYDDDLHLETYQFEGMIRPFPNHFHEYYVIGFMEKGARILSCKNQEYFTKSGDILLFNPGDNHACIQSSAEKLDYRSFNITKTVIAEWTKEIAGKQELPIFSPTVIRDEEVNCCLRTLHEKIMQGTSILEKEESLFLLLSLLIRRYSRPISTYNIAQNEIEAVCTFMEQHYAERIDLEQLCRCAGLSKSTLLRAFTRSKGITPYRYLENIRISKAKTLLEQGIPPLTAALQTGFSDQSHFSNYFIRFIGLTPGVYQASFKDTGGCEP